MDLLSRGFVIAAALLFSAVLSYGQTPDTTIIGNKVFVRDHGIHVFDTLEWRAVQLENRQNRHHPEAPHPTALPAVAIGQPQVGHVLSANPHHPLNNCGVTASFTPGNDSVIKNGPFLVYFTNTSTNATSVTWYEQGYQISNGNTIGIAEPPGLYTIMLVARNGACTDTAISYWYYSGTEPADRNNIKAYYGTPMDEHSQSLAAVPTGGYLLGGYGYSTIYDGWAKAMLTKTSESGCIEWSKKINNGGGGGLWKVLALRNGGYACTGYNDNINYFMKLDASGNELWTKIFYFDGQPMPPQWATETADGGFALLALTPEGITVLRLDTNGNIVWTKAYVYTSPNSTWYYLGDILAQGSDLYVTGNLITNIGSYSTSGPPPSTSGFVLKINDADGTTQWTRQYTMNGTYITPRDIHAYGSDLLLNSTGVSAAPNANNTIHVLDVNGNPIRSTTLSTPGLSYGLGSSYLLPLTTGEIYVLNSGTQPLDLQPLYAYHSFFIKLDANQDLLWSLTYGHYTGGKYFFPALGQNNTFAALGDEIGQLVETYNTLSYKEMFKKFDPSAGSVYNYGCGFTSFPITLTPETLSGQPFSWTAENAPTPSVTDTTLVLYPIYAQVRYECPEFVDSCSFLKLTGPRSVCDLSGNYTYRAHRNNACAQPIKWELPPNATLVGQTDSTITLNFSAFGSYRIGASLPFACSPLGDSLFVTASSSSGTLNLGNDTTICPYTSFFLHAGPRFLHYQWQDGGTDSVFKVTAPGTYFVQAADSCGNVQQDTMLVSPFLDPTFTAGPDRVKCNADTLHLDAPSGYLSYSWSPNYNLNTTAAQHVVIDPSVDTAYVLKAEKVPGCFSYDTVRITVYHSPPIQLGADKSICIGDSLLLDAGAGFAQYQWTTGATGEQITVNNKGAYAVKGTTGEGCISADTLNVSSLWPLPAVDLDHDPNICTGGARTLTAAPGNSYLWSTGSTAGSIVVSDTGSYTVIVTDGNGCRNRDSTHITTFLPIVVDFLPGDTAICSYGEVAIAPTQKFRSYLWSTGSTDESIAVTKPGTYWLEATDRNNCVSTDTILVAKKQCIEGFYIPNAFTPAGTGNNLFKPLLFGNIVGYEFAVYDRWGQLVFRSNRPEEGWDGNYRGSPRTAGVYVWLCRFTLEGEPQQIRKGTVMLIR